MFQNCSFFNFGGPPGLLLKIAYGKSVTQILWDTSEVKDMSNMFAGCSSFNRDLNKWNVSNVTNMKNMFSACLAFNKPLSDWKPTNVTNMSGMFNMCRVFNQDISKWNTSNVKEMRYMFQGCKHFRQKIRVAKTVDDTGMFLASNPWFKGTRAIGGETCRKKKVRKTRKR
jgi:surface protein